MLVQVLMQLAERRNVQPLPEIKKRFGLRLPPEEDCLLGGNYHLARGAAALASEPAQAMDTDRCLAVTNSPSSCDL